WKAICIATDLWTSVYIRLACELLFILFTVMHHLGVAERYPVRKRGVSREVFCEWSMAWRGPLMGLADGGKTFIATLVQMRGAARLLRLARDFSEIDLADRL